MNTKTIIIIGLISVIIIGASLYVYDELNEDCANKLGNIMRDSSVFESDKMEFSGTFTLNFDEDFTEEDFTKMATNCMILLDSK